MGAGDLKPYPCGYHGHPRRKCRCTELARRSYQARLSGPLLDRLDVHVNVPPVEVAALVGKAHSESSATMRERVLKARQVQFDRFRRGEASGPTNSTLTATELDRVAPLDSEGKRRLEQAITQFGLSARAFVKVRRVARTIADLEGSTRVRDGHVYAAIQGRLFDRQPVF